MQYPTPSTLWTTEKLTTYNEHLLTTGQKGFSPFTPIHDLYSDPLFNSTKSCCSLPSLAYFWREIFSSVLEVKATVCKHDLRQGKCFGYNNIIVEGDSQVLMIKRSSAENFLSSSSCLSWNKFCSRWVSKGIIELACYYCTQSFVYERRNIEN